MYTYSYPTNIHASIYTHLVIHIHTCIHTQAHPTLTYSMYIHYTFVLLSLHISPYTPIPYTIVLPHMLTYFSNTCSYTPLSPSHTYFVTHVLILEIWGAPLPCAFLDNC